MISAPAALCRDRSGARALTRASGRAQTFWTARHIGYTNSYVHKHITRADKHCDPGGQTRTHVRLSARASTHLTICRRAVKCYEK